MSTDEPTNEVAPAGDAPQEDMVAAVIDDAVPVEEPIVEPVVIPEPEPTPEPELVVAVAEEKPVAVPKVKRAPARHVVTDAAKDPVFLSACVYMNKFNRKSLTVHHLQRRLDELGYGDAAADKDGWYGELTAHAVAQFQKDNRIEATGQMNAQTFQAVFNGDANVEVNL